MHRFFVPGSYEPGDQADLPDDEAQHLTRVLRLHAGDRVRVFDGRGREYDATIVSASKAAARVCIDEPRPAVPEPHIVLTLAHAVLKGDKMDDVVRDAVMMGAAAVQPILTTRTEVTLAALARGGRRDRWSRVAISSAKQCGRAVVPAIYDPMPFGALVAALNQLTLPQPALMLVEPTAEGAADSLTGLEITPPREATLVIGPEGGWTPEEVLQASSVCRLVRLGGRTLRADAMATVAIASVFTHWHEF